MRPAATIYGDFVNKPWALDLNSEHRGDSAPETYLQTPSEAFKTGATGSDIGLWAICANLGSIRYPTQSEARGGTPGGDTYFRGLYRLKLARMVETPVVSTVIGVAREPRETRTVTHSALSGRYGAS